jgi:ABC-type glycerol-3-phosphate transport system substrate-binding protein
MSTETLKQFKGVEWASENFDPDQGVYVVPLDLQFYNGFYNKELFAKAGIDTFPTTWDELFAACDKLKAAGVKTPFTYGPGGQALGGGFYPWYDVSYLMMYLRRPTGGLHGEIPDGHGGLAQFDGGSLITKGCTNSDVLTPDSTPSSRPARPR